MFIEIRGCGGATSGTGGGFLRAVFSFGCPVLVLFGCPVLALLYLHFIFPILDADASVLNGPTHLTMALADGRPPMESERR